MHGGTSTGAKTVDGKKAVSKNAMRSGSIYAQYLTDEEREQFANLELGRVDDELRLQRIRLARALKAEYEDELGEGLQLDESIERVGGELALDEKKYKRRDYAHIIDRITGRIESLEKTRVELIKVNPPGDTENLFGGAEYTLKPDDLTPKNPIL